MRVSLKINSFEFGPYIVEDGISMSKEDRVSKSLTTMDGTKIEHKITKRKIQVTLHDRMYDSYYTALVAHLTPNPATVIYTDFDTGTTVTGSFYVEGPDHDIHRTYGTVTEISGITFELTER